MTNLKSSQKIWNNLAREDAFSAVLTYKEKKGNKWDAEGFFQTGVDEVSNDMKYVLSLADVKKGSALDFGCGVGRLTQALAPHFKTMYGIDISSQMIEIANRYNTFGTNCRYIVNIRNDLSLIPNNSLDFIYSKITLQHMRFSRAQRYMREFVRILTPGGILFFQLPSAPLRPVQSGSWYCIKKIVPAACIEFLQFTLKKKSRAYVYPTDQEKVIHILEKSGMALLGVREDFSDPKHWRGYQYCAKKRT